jgi:hypothetical protein
MTRYEQTTAGIWPAIYWRIPTDHCDEGRVFWVIKLEGQGVAVPRERYVLNRANFDIICDWRGSARYDKQTVGGLTRTLDRYGNILALARLGGEFPRIGVGKEGGKEEYDGYLHGSKQALMPLLWRSVSAPFPSAGRVRPPVRSAITCKLFGYRGA